MDLPDYGWMVYVQFDQHHDDGRLAPFTFAFEVHDGLVDAKRSAPVSRRHWGRPGRDVVAWYRERGARVHWSPLGPRLALVGSTDFSDPSAKATVQAAMAEQILAIRPGLVLSGGARGADIWARLVAQELGYARPTRLREYLPANPRWAPDGYQARNALMAQACTHLRRWHCRDSSTFGSGWTAQLARALGRDVEEHQL